MWAWCQPEWHRALTEEAEELHRSVSPSKWCVKHEDLLFFESEVRRSIRAGILEDSDDGPSIYAVNEGYIKPVTQAAGKMSWALMVHPNGLDCDLFISHAWAESVFEFTGKVLTSWPWRAHHAWCCMLANPQHLDLAALLQTPSSSPFALALQSAKHVLVVPTRHTSIYTRLWCGYEVYLAFEHGKIVQTAMPPIWHKVVWSWFRMSWILIGLIILAASNTPTDPKLVRICAFFPLGTALVSQTSGKRSVCLVANHLGLATTLALTYFGWTEPDFDSPMHPSIIPWLADETLYMLSASTYFLFAEVERVYWEAEDASAEELWNGYSGSIQHALCSDPRDQVNILGEISKKLDEVDSAVLVLLQNGVTSDALRYAHQHGVRLERSGGVPLAIPGLMLGPFFLMGCILVGRELARFARGHVPSMAIPAACFHFVTMIARIHLVALLMRRSIDERSWILHVLGRTIGVSFFGVLVFFILTARDGYPILPRRTAIDLRSLCELFYHISSMVAWYFCVLGIRGTVDAPNGKFLANLFLRRLVGHVEEGQVPANPTSDSDESTNS